jgi:hypothetical protein
LLRFIEANEQQNNSPYLEIDELLAATASGKIARNHGTGALIEHGSVGLISGHDHLQTAGSGPDLVIFAHGTPMKTLAGFECNLPLQLYASAIAPQPDYGVAKPGSTNSTFSRNGRKDSINPRTVQKQEEKSVKHLMASSRCQSAVWEK